MKTKAVKRLEALQRAQSHLEGLLRAVENIKLQRKALVPGNTPMSQTNHRLSMESSKAHEARVVRQIERAVAHIAHLKTLVAADKPY